MNAEYDHVYLSTSCFHDLHDYCQSATGYSYEEEQFNKRPAQCKFCNAPCVCSCHQEAPRG